MEKSEESPTPTTPNQGHGKGQLCAECLLLFFVLPLILPFFRRELAFKTVPIVALVTLGCYAYLIRSSGFERTVLWRTRGLTAHLKKILLVFLLPAAGLTLLTCSHQESLFLVFPRTRPFLWLLVVLLYPALVGYPQEMVFRVFFFHRYGPLFPAPVTLILANGLSFGLFHLFYGNWIAPILSALGGVLFAYRYWKTKSLLAVAIEHGLWGDFLFTVGLGWYFYSGSI